MVNGVNQGYISAYDALLENVPALSQKIESGNLSHNDTLSIARSVRIKKNENGSISIKKRLLTQPINYPIASDLINLVREICSYRKKEKVHRSANNRKLDEDNSETALEKQKKVSDDIVAIRRGKRKTIDLEESKPTKKNKQDKPALSKIEEVENFFRFDSSTPTGLLGMIVKYVDESTVAFVINDFVSKMEIPNYLKESVSSLDLSKEHLTIESFRTLVNEFKKLKSIKLPEYADDLWLEELSKALPKLESLDVTNCKKITNDGLHQIAFNMNSLQKLNLSGCNIGDVGVDIILQRQRLQGLNLSSCYKVTDEAFKHVNESGDSLEYLDLSSKGITDKGIYYIVDGVKGLKSLNLKNSPRLTNDGIDYAIQGFKELEHLDLSGCSITDAGLISFNQLAKSLKSFKLNGSPQITGEFLSHISQNFEVLKEFSFSFCSIFEESNLIHIRGKFSALERLDVSGVVISGFEDNEYNVNYEGISHILQGVQKLESLELHRIGLENEDWNRLANECKNLKKLVVDGCNISSQGINSIFAGCTDLQELNLSCCDIDDSGLESIADKRRKLLKLDLSHCNKITDKGLESISIGCPDLRSINLNYCSITDNGLLHLSNGIESLEELSIAGKCDITFKSIEYISKWRESLQRLTIRQCDRIDDKAFMHLSQSFPLLNYLNLDYMDVSNDTFRHFAEWFPSLEMLSLVCNSNITEDTFQYIRELPLKDLNLQNCKITDKGLRQIYQFTRLCKLNVICFVCGYDRTIIDDLRRRGIEVVG